MFYHRSRVARGTKHVIDSFTPLGLQSNQVKRTPQEYINEFIIQKLN